MSDTEPSNKNSGQQKVNQAKKNRRLGVWSIVGIVAAALLVAVSSGGGYLIHLSNTSPQFCATCHIMDRYVTSYLSSNDLDNLHFQANVGCKECHDYPVSAEIRGGVNYVIGNYTVDENGELLQVVYEDDICLQCHISKEFVAQATDFLAKNPHDSHNGMMACNTCHVSHGDQIDYCSRCHDNGGQRMTGEERVPRGTIDQLNLNQD